MGKSQFLLFLIFLAVCGIKGFAQTENTLYMMDNVYQASYSNPMAVPQYKLHIGVPALSSISGYGFIEHHNLESTTYESDGKLFFDEDLIVSNSDLRKKNYVNFGAAVDLISVRFRTGTDFFWSLNVSDRVSSSFRYPKEFAELVTDGNEQFIGQPIDLSELAINTTYYREFGVGLLHTGEKWNWSVKPKLLFGIANVKTSVKSINYNVEKNEIKDDSVIFRQTAFIDGVVHTSGVDTTGEKYDKGGSYWNTKNMGFAVDFGATYKVNERLEISASVVDLGFIRWRDEVINYNFNGDTSYVGIDLAEQLNDSDQDVGTDIDSLSEAFKFKKSYKAYTSALNYKVNISGRYRFARRTYANLLLQFNNYAGFRPLVSVGIYHEFGRIFNLAISNSFQNNELLNLGMAFALNIKPVQIYIATDKLDGLFNLAKIDGAVVPYTTNYFNFRFGVNLIFGNIHVQEQIPIDND